LRHFQLSHSTDLRTLQRGAFRHAPLTTVRLGPFQLYAGRTTESIALNGGNQSMAARTKVTLDNRVSGEVTVGLLLDCS